MDLTVQEQIYGLSHIWCEAKYNFAFWNTRKNVEWDKEYMISLKKVSYPMPLIDYYLELMRFISLLNDGHSHVDFPREIYKQIKSLPIKIRWLGGKHIITNTDKSCDIPVFSEILKINGEDFDTYMNEKILPYCWNIKPTSSYENLYSFSRIERDCDKNAYSLIPIIEKSSLIELTTSCGTFTVEPSLKVCEWNLPVKLECGEELQKIFDSEGMQISITKDKIAIITFPSFMDDNMPENFFSHAEVLRNCKGFIIDIRNNEGGHSQNVDMFSQAFIDGEFKTGKVKHAVHIGAYKAWGFGENFENWDMSDGFNKKIYDICCNNLFEEEISSYHNPDCPVCFKQPVVILINASTASSSENLLLNFDYINRAIIVGVPSYGSTGNPLFIPLPGNGMARVCTRRYTYPDDREFINIGIQPHVYADLSREDLQNGCDSVLNKGLEILRSKI